jgi:hypothetical protein
VAVNQSNKGAPNVAGDFGLKELDKIRVTDLASQSAQDALLQHRWAQAETRLNAATAARPGYEDNGEALKVIDSMIAKSRKTMETIEPRLDLNAASKQDRLNRRSVNVIERAYSESAINGMVQSSINTPETQLRAAGLSRASWEDLMSQKQGILGQISAERGNNRNLAEHLVNGDKMDQDSWDMLQASATRTGGLVGQLGPIQAAMKILRQQGLDPESKQLKLEKMGGHAEDILRANNMQDAVRGGAIKFSPEEMKRAEAEASTRLVEALNDLRSAAGKTKEELALLKDNAEEAAKDFEMLHEAQAAGAGKGPNDYARWASYMGTASGIAGAASNLFQNVGVSQPLQMMGNIAGYGGIENQKYDMYRAAIGGDMSAALRYGGINMNHAFGKFLTTGTGWSKGAQTAGGLFDATGGLLQIADPTSAASGGVSQGFGSLAQGGSNAISGGLDLAQHVSTSQAEIAGYHASDAAVAANTYVTGKQAQKYYDYMMGLRGAAVNMGTQADSFINEAGGVGFMGQMQDAGLSMPEMTQLSQFGVGHMGNTFNLNQVLKAKQMENMGLGTAMENMQRMAGLSVGGSQNPEDSLEHIIEAGTAKGVTNSKALNDIAQHTGTLVKQATMRGSGETANEISRNIIGLIGHNPADQETAVEKAATVFGSQEALRTNRAASFAGFVGISRLQKDLGMNWENAQAVQGMSTAQLQHLSGAKYTTIMDEFGKMGVDLRNNDAFWKNPQAFVQQIIKDKTISEVENGGVGMALQVGKNWDKTIGTLRGDKTGKLTEQFINADVSKLPADLASQSILMHRSWKMNHPDQDADVEIRGLLATLGVLGPEELKKPGAPTGGYKSLTETLNRPGQSDSAEAALAARMLGQSGGVPLSGSAGAYGINQSLRNIQESVGDKPAEHWATAAADAAATLGESATKLGDASDKLMIAADNMITLSKMKSTFGLNTLYPWQTPPNSSTDDKSKPGGG